MNMPTVAMCVEALAMGEFRPMDPAELSAFAGMEGDGYSLEKDDMYIAMDVSAGCVTFCFIDENGEEHRATPGDAGWQS